jgi:hypothetical protein
MPQLKSSEKRLLIAFGVLIFGAGNFFLYNFGKKKMDQVEGEYLQAESSRNLFKEELPDKILWEKRRAWLEAEQPVFTTEEDKAPKLQNSIDEMALLTGVTVSMKPIELNVEAYHQHIGIIGEVKGSGEQVMRFASLLQDQGRFRELLSFNVKSEKNDPSRLVLQFTLNELYSLNSNDPESIETEQPAEATASTGTSGEKATVPLPAG